jgi:Na+/glutamate symporter
VSPFFKNRHETWRSDSVITGVILLCVLIATVVTDWLNGPDQQAPTYLTGLLGAAATAFFVATGSDKNKIDADTKDTANRAEAKVDALAQVAEQQHPESASQLHPPFEGPPIEGAP